MRRRPSSRRNEDVLVLRGPKVSRAITIIITVIIIIIIIKPIFIGKHSVNFYAFLFYGKVMHGYYEFFFVSYTNVLFLSSV